ncbi:MAG: glycosyltransferase family protein [Acidimicrobiales bacterium]
MTIGRLPGVAARHRLLENRQILRDLEANAAGYLTAGNVEMALLMARSGSDWAWFNHTGMYASPVLERVVATCGRVALQDTVPRARAHGPGDHVLHVLTQAYPTGGHTRLAWRWMHRDSVHQHSVALVGQGDHRVPERLEEAVTGTLHHIGNDASTVRRIRELAAIVADHDLVVLHIHPHDVVSVAACAGLTTRPPTLFVNHADHVFWLGLSGADAVVNLRPSGRKLSASRRGVSERRNLSLPLPLEAPPQGRGAEARARLGIAEHGVVFLTVAQPYKYADQGRVGFVELARRALQLLPDGHLVAVGPSTEDNSWAELAAAVPGRVHLLGTRTDLPAITDAADIYLDSFPCTSVTSVLEAAAIGIPVLCFGEPDMDHPLRFDDFALRPRYAATPTAWINAVEEWCEDATLRRSEGARMQSETLQGHIGPEWENSLDVVYRSVRLGAATGPAAASGAVAPFDVMTLELHERGGLTREADSLLRVHGMISVDAPE